MLNRLGGGGLVGGWGRGGLLIVTALAVTTETRGDTSCTSARQTCVCTCLARVQEPQMVVRIPSRLGSPGSSPGSSRLLSCLENDGSRRCLHPTSQLRSLLHFSLMLYLSETPRETRFHNRALCDVTETNDARVCGIYVKHERFSKVNGGIVRHDVKYTFRTR